MRTYSVTLSEVRQRWYVVDATGVSLGRLASEVAQLIRGKHKPIFSPHLDTGDNVVVINAAAVRLTGRKLEQKRYFSHSGYMGHERLTPVRAVLSRNPARVVERAVYGMLPKNTLARGTLRRKLRVYAGSEHPHGGQQPIPLTLRSGRAKGKA